MPVDPVREYAARLEARRAAGARLDRADARLSHARLATFGAGVVTVIAVWLAGASFLWLGVPATIFLWLIRRHDTVIREQLAARRGAAFYERGLERLADRWSGTGGGDRFREDLHTYANDLDLFGPGSLFELLSLARTRTGEAVLARWLTSQADAGEVRSRQDAVAELRDALDLRERMALAGADLRAAVQSDRLIEWAREPLPPARRLHVTTWILTCACAAGILWMSATSEWRPLAVLLLVQGIVFHRQRQLLETIVTGAGRGGEADFVGDSLVHRTADLGVVADVLRHLEAAAFRGARLVALRERLAFDGNVPASRIIRRLQRLSEIRGSTSNLAVFPLGLFLLGELELSLALGTLVQLVAPHVVLGVDRWRRRHGPAVPGWLEAIGEFEALSSLSGYHFEHPDDVFPELLTSERGGHGQLDGRQLGHPLLPADTMVRNDVRLAGDTQLLVLSGSNMSGKSTLLRTVGINAVLALAGAPVRASSLRLTPVVIGATLRIQDSLQEGRSRFYAEITRIRELSDMADGAVPLLFLLDELFHGTNSHDRLVGASGVLRSFVERGAIGLITTHDLALTAVADELAPRAVNVHFEDWFDGGDIRFDYRVKPGPVTRSNALALMRAVGLKVEAPSGR
ncbi:MAG TPA: hypothetical protein VLD67_20260 [Vicinamibacterales bacterium]|nr:hypothetical protein [Vicinamibacterales bacterium]